MKQHQWVRFGLGAGVVLMAMALLLLATRPAQAQTAPLTTPVTATVYLPQISTFHITQPLAVGLLHSCTIVPSGRAYCWGTNDKGQLGDGTTQWRATAAPVVGLPGGATAIGAGPNDTCAAAGGSVWCWGEGYGPSPMRIDGVPPAIVSLGYSCALIDTGRVYCWTADTPATQREGIENAVALASGPIPCAVLRDGTVHCWDIPLYDMSPEPRMLEVKEWPGVSQAVGVVSYYSGGLTLCFLRRSGSVACWTGDPHEGVGPPTALRRDLFGALALKSGRAFICAVFANGDAICGNHDWNAQPTDGQGGLGTQIGGDAPAIGVVATSLEVRSHVCARGAAGEVWCWGTNVGARLGNPAAVAHWGAFLEMPVAGSQSVDTSWNQTCTVDGAGRVWCWGGAESPLVSTQATYNLSERPFDVPMQRLRMSWGVICAQPARGSITCRSTYESSDWFITIPESRNARDFVQRRGEGCYVRADGAVRCWGDVSSPLVSVPGASKARTIAVGTMSDSDHRFCSTTEAGSIECWDFQTGVEPTPATTLPNLIDIKQVALGFWSNCALRNDGRVLCWGTEGEAKPTLLEALSDVMALANSTDRFCALRSDGRVLCWGDAHEGGSLLPTERGRLEGATALAVGGGHQCVVAGGKLFCMGDNMQGQLARNPGWTPVRVEGLNE